MVTKSDNHHLVSKSLKSITTNQDKQQKSISTLEQDVSKIKKDVNYLKTKFDLIEKKFDNLHDFVEKKYSDIFDLIDSLASEYRDQQEFRAITTNNISEHEKRLTKLEKTIFAS